MIKIFLSSILLVITFLASSAQYREVKQWDYTVSIPQDWLPISKVITKQLEMQEVEYKHYVVGYSAVDSSSFARPYVILNYHGIPGSENVLFKEVIDIQAGILKRKGIDANFVVDSSRYHFYTELESAGMKMYGGYSMGNNGILYVNFYPAEDDAQGKEKFLDILNSVKHNEAFQNRNQNLAEAEEHQKKSGQYMMYALIGFGLLLLMYFMKKKVW